MESETELAIASDDDIDVALGDKAHKHNMTALNVKSFIRHVIQHPRTLSTLLHNDAGDVLDSTKVTRSKTKQLAQSGQIDWPDTPLKEPAVQGRTFLNVEFSDSDNDDEWQPTANDTEVRDDTDDDFDLTQPSTSGSHQFRTMTRMTLTTPDVTMPSTSRLLMNSNLSSSQKTRSRLSSSSVDVAPAKHTRSKHQLPNLPCNVYDDVLFNADPDVAMDTGGDYDALRGQSPTYVQWLQSIQHPTPIVVMRDERPIADTPMTEENDEDDPEYLYDDFEEVDIWEVQQNRKTEIPKREVKALLADAVEAFDPEAEVLGLLKESSTKMLGKRQQSPQPTRELQQLPVNALTGETTWQTIDLGNVSGRHPVTGFTLAIPDADVDDEQLLEIGPDDEVVVKAEVKLTKEQDDLLNQQIRMHLQLLLQLNLLARTDPNLETNEKVRNVKLDTSRMINDFVNHPICTDPALSTQVDGLIQTYNEFDAISEDYYGKDVKVPHSVLKTPVYDMESEKAKALQLPRLPFSLRIALAHSPVVVYPSLLPLCASTSGQKRQNSFTVHDDRLIISGIVQFNGAISETTLEKRWLERDKQSATTSTRGGPVLMKPVVNLALCSLIQQHMCPLFRPKAILHHIYQKNKSRFSVECLKDLQMALEFGIMPKRRGELINYYGPTPSQWIRAFQPVWLLRLTEFETSLTAPKICVKIPQQAMKRAPKESKRRDSQLREIQCKPPDFRQGEPTKPKRARVMTMSRATSPFVVFNTTAVGTGIGTAFENMIGPQIVYAPIVVPAEQEEMQEPVTLVNVVGEVAPVQLPTASAVEPTVVETAPTTRIGPTMFGQLDDFATSTTTTSVPHEPTAATPAVAVVQPHQLPPVEPPVQPQQPTRRSRTQRILQAESTLHSVNTSETADWLAGSIHHALRSAFALHADKERGVREIFEEHRRECDCVENEGRAVCEALYPSITNMLTSSSTNTSHPMSAHVRLMSLCDSTIDQRKNEFMTSAMALKRISTYATSLRGRSSAKTLMSKLSRAVSIGGGCAESSEKLYEAIVDALGREDKALVNEVVAPLFAHAPFTTQRDTVDFETIDLTNEQRVADDDRFEDVVLDRKESSPAAHGKGCLKPFCEMCAVHFTPDGVRLREKSSADVAIRLTAVENCVNTLVDERPERHDRPMPVDQGDPSTLHDYIPSNENTMDIMRTAMKAAFGVSRLSFNDEDSVQNAAQSVINQDVEPVTWEEGEDERIMDAMQSGGTVTEIVAGMRGSLNGKSDAQIEQRVLLISQLTREHHD